MKQTNWKQKMGIIAAIVFGMSGSVSAQSSETSSSSIQAKAYDMVICDDMQDPILADSVYVSGIDLGGKPLSEAKEFVESYTSTRESRAITLTVFGENEYQYNSASFGVDWGNEEMLHHLEDCALTGNFVEQYKKQKEIEANPVDLTVDFGIDKEAIRKEVQALADYYSIEPVNAKATRVPEGFSVTPDITGKTFDVDAITEELAVLISDFENTDAIVYDLPYMEIEAEYKAEDMSFNAILGQYSTGNLGSAGRLANLQVSSSGINGTIVYPGQEVSALSLYGAITTANGYQLAPGYELGKQVDTVGGGICQTTTTLYNALLLAELTITKRYNHSMIVTYVPPSMDAAVAPGIKDMTFRNDWSYPVYLESYIHDGRLYVIVWGIEERPAGRTIKYTTEVLECVFPDPLYVDIVNDTICPVGEYQVSRKITAPVETHPAIKSKSYKEVYIDGVLTSRTPLNSDSYGAMAGQMIHSSDCTVYNEVRSSSSPNAVYKYMGIDIYHEVRDLEGNTWSGTD